VYLGVYESPESRAEYGRLIAELATAPDALPGGPADYRNESTVDQVLLAFWQHAEQHYRRTDGTPTSEISEYKRFFRPWAPSPDCNASGPVHPRPIRYLRLHFEPPVTYPPVVLRPILSFVGDPVVIAYSQRGDLFGNLLAGCNGPLRVLHSVASWADDVAHSRCERTDNFAAVETSKAPESSRCTRSTRLDVRATPSEHSTA